MCVRAPTLARLLACRTFKNRGGNETDKVDNSDGSDIKKNCRIRGAIHFSYILEIFHNIIDTGVVPIHSYSCSRLESLIL